MRFSTGSTREPKFSCVTDDLILTLKNQELQGERSKNRKSRWFRKKNCILSFPALESQFGHFIFIKGTIYLIKNQIYYFL